MNTTINQKLFWVTGFAGGFTTLASLAFVLQGSNLVSGTIHAAASLALSLAILNLLRSRAKV